MVTGGAVMRAVRYDGFGGIEVLRVEEVARPVPAGGQVLVQVKAAGINPGEAGTVRPPPPKGRSSVWM